MLPTSDVIHTTVKALEMFFPLKTSIQKETESQICDGCDTNANVESTDSVYT